MSVGISGCSRPVWMLVCHAVSMYAVAVSRPKNSAWISVTEPGAASIS